MSICNSRAGWLIAASSLISIPAASGPVADGPLPIEAASGEAHPAELAIARNVGVTNGRRSGDSPCESVPTQIDVQGDLAIEAADEQRYSLDVATPGALAVEVPATSSLVVSDSVSSQLEVILCRRTWAATEDAARSLLKEIALQQESGRLVAVGPGDSTRGVWTANLIIKVPKGLVLDLYADRGSISLKATTHDVRAFSRHGGIYAAPVGGTVALESENGSIDLRLADTSSWIGQGVVASSRNGSVRAYLPSSSPFAAISATSRFGAIHTTSESLRRQIDSPSQPSADADAPRLALATVNGPLFLYSQSAPDRDKK